MPPPELFSAAETRYLLSHARPLPSAAARQLAKELVQELLAPRGIQLESRLIEILGDTPGRSGPPRCHLPAGTLPASLDLQLSLSHSATHAAALVVLVDTHERTEE